MKHNEIMELLRHIEEVARADKGALSRLVAMTKNTAPVFHNALLAHDAVVKRELAATLPSRDKITAAQFTLYDNWQHTGGRKPSRRKKEANARMQRFKAQLEVWTTAPGVLLTSKNRAKKVTFDLMDQSERAERMAKYRNPKESKGGFVVIDGKPVSQAWEDFAADILQAPNNTLCGPAYSTALDGTSYVLGSVAMIDANTAHSRPDGMEIIVTLGGGEHLTFHSFERSYANGAPLESNAAAISRLAHPTDHAGWRTGVMSCPTDQKEITPDECPY